MNDILSKSIKKANVGVNSADDMNHKVGVLKKDLFKLYNNKQYGQSVLIANKIISMAQDEDAYKLKADATLMMGDLDGALELYQQAKRIFSKTPNFSLQVAFVLGALKRYNEAIDELNQCLSLFPNCDTAYSNLAVMLESINANIEVIKLHYVQAIKINPNLVRAYASLIRLMISQRDLKGAAEIASVALKRFPQDKEVLILSGMVCGEVGQADQSVVFYEKAYEIDKNVAVVVIQLLKSYRDSCSWDKEQAVREHLLSNFDALFLNHLATTLDSAMTNVSPFQVMACNVPLDKYKRSTEKYVANRLVSLNNKKYSYSWHHDKIRVGYVSPDFNNHPVGLLISNLFRYHDRETIEVYGYYLRGEYTDELTDSIASSCDTFRAFTSESYVDISDQINADEIDILIDLAGYTNSSKPKIFDIKPSPIQCHMLGYPGSMVSPTIDYYITTQDYTPKAIAKHFTESMVYLPETQFAIDNLTFKADLPTRAELGLPKNGFVFACFNADYRIDKDTFETWMTILKRVPDSVLWLTTKDSVAAKLKNYAEACGVDGSRLVFTQAERMTHRGMFRLADMMLESLSVTSGTSAVIALSGGVPILTVAGNTPHSRTCHLVLIAAALDNYSYPSIPAYIDAVVLYATDNNAYKVLQEDVMRCKKQSPLFNPKRLAMHLDAAYQQMMKSENAKNDIHVPVITQ